MMYKFPYLVLVFLLISIAGVQAQKKVVNQGLYWVRYYNMLTLDKHFTWHNEAEMRRFWQGDVQHQFIAHTRMHYKTGANTNVGVGFTYSRQSPQDPLASSKLVVPEYRGVQEFNYSIPISRRFSLQQRLRLDERFIRRNDGVELLEGSNFTLRFRLRLQANWILSREGAPRRTTLKVSNEVMFNVGKSIVYNQFDQNRIYVGVEKEFSRMFSAELGYLKWYQQTASGNAFFNRDIVRFTLYHKLKL